MSLLALCLAAVHLVVQWLSAFFALRQLGMARVDPGAIGQPHVTLLRPVCGLDPQDAATLASGFVLDYPSYDLVFCAPSENDPAVALVQDLIAAHPQRQAVLLYGIDASFRNPKLANVVKGWQATGSDWVCMTDSNLMLPSDYLAQVTAAWGADSGMVSSPPLISRASNVGGWLESAFLNANQARLQMAVAALGRGFAQGKTLFFNKPLLESLGGLAALDRNLAEDVNATRLVRAAGRNVAMTRQLFAQPIGCKTMGQVWGRQLRWAQVRREGFPGLYLLEPLNTPLLPGLALAFVVPAMLLPYFALWYLAEALWLRRASDEPVLPVLALAPLRDLLVPAIWGVALMRDGFEWRGNAVQSGPAQAGGDVIDRQVAV